MIVSVQFSPTTAQQIHLVFEWLAILFGVQTYRWIKRGKGQEAILAGSSFVILLGCILGAGIGNKLVFAAEYPQLWTIQGWQVLLQGQSIVGGLLGGLIGVEIAKKITSVQQSTGDDFVLPLIVGTIVGRIGCFLAGLHDSTFGLPTGLLWGIDFGDGIARHPTQIYDMLAVSSFGLLLWLNRKQLAKVSGLSFKLYLSSYLIWRLLIDNIKPVPYSYWLNLSGIQWVCIVALLLYLPFLHRDCLKLKPSTSL
jgi:prolipoprotein diacylglyceryltransferase